MLEERKESSMKNVIWQRRDSLALLVIPLELTLGWLANKTSLDDAPYLAAVVPFALKFLSVALMLFLFHDLFRTDWKLYKQHLWQKLLFSAAGVAVVYFLLASARWLTGHVQSFASSMDSITGGLPYGLYLLASASPLLAPITEETVFRHVLFYRWKDSPPLRVVSCLVSAILFGAVHLNNFGGNLLATVPYMVIGLYYNLLYYFTKNIWTTTVIHLIFNFIQSLLPALLIPLLLAINS